MAGALQGDAGGILLGKRMRSQPWAATRAGVRLSPWRVWLFLMLTIAALVITSFAFEYLKLTTEIRVPGRLFNLDTENNIPTWFSSAQLTVASVLLFFIARAENAGGGAHGRHFYGLCVGFLYLSIDETASIHEAAIAPVQRLLNTSGALYAAWVIPAMVAVLIFAIVYLKFFLALPRKYQILMGAAGLMYVGGAIGFEMISWNHRFPNFTPGDMTSGVDVMFVILNHIEEMLEMSGVALFVATLLAFMADRQIAATLTADR